ncbi:pleiotropic drug resistance protein 1-like [Syzygium oleosum]|uniref:pleiotropic drug resistance protein 1-like n=1 Tax=Syzygium oleosum TaxID=219896 RepID=UPI0024B8FDE6|nr:pleiotropic drug resistance protein 1-like [Syzygium oleosum]
MDTGDVFRISSARLSSSNIWRNSGKEIFSRSSRDEDDEEALKWAALEKLPTYLRIRRGILAEEEGQIREVDIENLGSIERRNLLERLLNTAEEDNEKFLLKLKKRIERVGLDFPSIEVRFEHLNVEAGAYVGSRALPTIFNFSVNILAGFLNYFHILPSRKKPLPILNDVSGIIKPCRMTLLLGPPGSGKTTLLLALAGKLGNDLKSSGRVTYNGHGMKEFVPQRTSAYISQYDLHIGELTVRETLAFSVRCQGMGSHYGEFALFFFVTMIRRAVAMEGKETNIVTDYILKVTSRKDQEQYWAHKDSPYRFVTLKEFSEAFQSFHIGQKVGDQLAIPFDKSKGHPAALTTKKYGVSKLKNWYS